jgi:hypothetical protein
MVERGATQQFRSANTLRSQWDEGCHGGFVGRDCGIEVSKMGYAALVEENVRRCHVSVNDVASMYMGKRTAKLAGCAEEVSEANLGISGLKISAVITESPARQVLEHKVWARRVKVEVMQCNDAVMRPHLTHHLHLSVASGGIRAPLQDSKGNLPMSPCLHVRCKVGPFALAMGNDTFDAISASED